MKHGNGKHFSGAKAVFQKHGGLLRTAEAIDLGIHPRTLYAMHEAGVLDQLSRGVFRLAALPPLGNPDLVTVAARAPQGVICLVSALSFHEITTQIPKEVYLAVKTGTEPPRVATPLTHVFRFSGKAFTEGVVIHRLDGIDVRIYDPEKTLADCFKFRNRIGMDAVLEALKLYKERKRFDVEKILRYAKICRVAKVITPYLEALL